jgi:hypothetical protein
MIFLAFNLSIRRLGVKIIMNKENKIKIQQKDKERFYLLSSLSYI